MQLVKIVTHHENPELACKLYLKERVIAVGFVYDKSVINKDPETIKAYFRKERDINELQVGKATSTYLKFRNDIEKGMIVFAYLGQNMVGLVGEVKGPYRFDDKNSVGDEKGEIGYPNQWRVKWWDSPRNFDRHFLPNYLSNWVSRVGTIAIQDFKELSKEKLREILEKIPSHTAVSKALEFHDENEIKDYMEKNMGEVESDLELVEREYQTSDGPMDFLSRDKEGRNVVIEVKLEAKNSTVSQLRRYMRAYKKDEKSSRVRGMIVAEKFSKGCLDDVAELKELGMDASLVCCRKKFGFQLL